MANIIGLTTISQAPIRARLEFTSESRIHPPGMTRRCGVGRRRLSPTDYSRTILFVFCRKRALVSDSNPVSSTLLRSPGHATVSCPPAVVHSEAQTSSPAWIGIRCTSVGPYHTALTSSSTPFTTTTAVMVEERARHGWWHAIRIARGDRWWAYRYGTGGVPRQLHSHRALSTARPHTPKSRSRIALSLAGLVGLAITGTGDAARHPAGPDRRPHLKIYPRLPGLERVHRNRAPLRRSDSRARGRLASPARDVLAARQLACVCWGGIRSTRRVRQPDFDLPLRAGAPSARAIYHPLECRRVVLPTGPGVGCDHREGDLVHPDTGSPRRRARRAAHDRL